MIAEVGPHHRSALKNNNPLNLELLHRSVIRHLGQFAPEVIFLSRLFMLASEHQKENLLGFSFCVYFKTFL